MKLPNIQTQIIENPTYSAYEQLIVDYMNELNSLVDRGGRWAQDTPAIRHELKCIHHKYHEMQKKLFPNAVGLEFNNLFVNNEDILA